MQTASAPTTNETAPKAPAKAKPTKSALQIALDEILARSKALKDVSTAQADRVRQIAVLEDERSIIRDALEAEKIDFNKASANIAEIGGKLDAHNHLLCRRSGQIVTEIHDIQSAVSNFKWNLVSSLNSASAFVLQNRFDELNGTVNGWGGKGITGTPWHAAAIAAACPILARLEQDREFLAALRPSEGLGTFAEVVKPILANLAEINAPEAETLLTGNYAEHNHTAVMGLRAGAESFECLASFSDSAKAHEFYNETRPLTGFYGYQKITRYTIARNDNEHSFDLTDEKRRDHNESFAGLEMPAQGDCPAFLEKVNNWLA